MSFKQLDILSIAAHTHPDFTIISETGQIIYPEEDKQICKLEWLNEFPEDRYVQFNLDFMELIRKYLHPDPCFVFHRIFGDEFFETKELKQ